jgi:polyhydroxyalkanoate synthase
MKSSAPKISSTTSRVGPRPLALHLGLATTSVASSLARLPLDKKGESGTGSQFSDVSEGLIESQAIGYAPGLLQRLADQGSEQMQDMINGIRFYHSHPYNREPRNRPVIWQRGTTELLDGAPDAPEKAPLVLLVPSLVNRAYILDLMPGRSLVDYLAGRGLHPILLDWNTPGEVERNFDIAEYITDRICPAIEFLSEMYGPAPLHLAGYCMGGTLSVAAAIRQQDKIRSFIAIAAPWDFHAEYSGQAKALIDQRELWATILDGFGEMPVDLLQTLFTSLDPSLGLRKFSKFGEMDMASAQAQEFVAIEDWLNDGCPLVRRVAEDVFDRWYGRNETQLGQWVVGNDIVRPRDISVASLIAVPKSDKIVPRPSALALASSLPSATVVTPPSGHVGMMAGSKAPSGLWRQLGDWVVEN